MDVIQDKSELFFQRLDKTLEYDSEFDSLIEQLRQDISTGRSLGMTEEKLAAFFYQCFQKTAADDTATLNQLTSLLAESYELFRFTPQNVISDLQNAEILIDCYLRISDCYLKQRNVTRAGRFVDVLYKLTAGSADLSMRWRILNSYARYHSLSDNFEKAHLLHLEALAAAEKCENPDYLKRSLLNAAGSLVDKYEYGKAGEYFNRLLKMLIPGKTEDSIFYVAAFNNIGEMHLRQGFFDTALTFFEKKIALLEKSPDQGALVGCYSDVGVINQKKGYLNKAKNCYMRDLNLSDAVGNKFGSARALANVGSIFLLQNKYDQSEECYLKSCKIAKELGNYTLYHTGVINLANIAIHKGMYDKALNYLQQQYKYCEERNMHNEVLQVGQNIVAIYLDNEKFDEAAELIEKSWKLAKSINNADIMISLLFAKCTLAFENWDYPLAESFLKKIGEELLRSPNKQHSATLEFCLSRLFFEQKKFTPALQKSTSAEQLAIEIGMEELVFEARLLSSQIRMEMDATEEGLKKEKEYLKKLLIGHSKEQSAEVYYYLKKIEEKILAVTRRTGSHDLTQYTQDCLKAYSIIVRNTPTCKAKKRLSELQNPL